MASKSLQRLTLAAVLVCGLGLLDAQPAAATRPVRRTARPQAARGFNLFAGAVNVMMNVNRVQCNINQQGETCVDPTNSSTVGGGFWPKGTPDQYIFNSGLQLAAVLESGSRATFPWAGDTVGAYIFDARGTQTQGEGLVPVFNGLNAEDVAAWPSAAYVRDTTLFSRSLIYTGFGGTAAEDRRTISQQDTWTRFWDGNPALLSGRQHPMGLLIDQRGLMWNFPSGNQDIVYFLYRFINITATDPARYANLAAYGYSASDIADIVAIAQDFQTRSEAQFNVTLPDAGWKFTQMYAAFGQDPDVANAGQNFSTAILPFGLGAAYVSTFYEPSWTYPADIFSAPFFAGPGFEGVKYLKSPTNPATGGPFGITMFTNTTNGPPFPDRVGVQELWRLFSGNLLAADGICTVDPRPVTHPSGLGRGMCALVQVQTDTRFYQASGPFTMNPGESAVIVVAYVHAAPVAGIITANGTTLFPPGIPGSPARLATGVDSLRTVERVAGWVHGASSNVSDQDANLDGYLDQREIPTVPRSLLNKALVAQAVFDAKFLLPFAPDGPTFFLIPGDNQVSVVWEKSVSETAGDPYYTVATDPLNSLYDPNFRRYDVEGYRIWRGRTESTMELVTAFDYAGSTITDKTGQFWNSDDYGTQCAPELGITTTCPVDFLAGETHDVSLDGEIIQVPPGGRVELATSGDVLIIAADTAITGGNSGLPGLTDTGVPFVYVDHAVRNGFQYYYAVTTFDVNSVASGPTSLESPLVTKRVTPRAMGLNRVSSTLEVSLVGSDGTVLDPTAAYPTIDATTGTLSGPFPPTTSFEGTASVFADQLVIPGTVTFTIDSIVPEWYHSATFYLSSVNGPTTQQYVLYSGQDSGPLGQENGTLTFDALGTRLRSDSALALSRGVDPVPFAGLGQALLGMQPPVWASQEADWTPDVAGSFFGSPSSFSRDGGSRWFDGANETMADPTLGYLHGQLTGVTTIYRPVRVRNASNLFRRLDQTLYHVARAADIKVYWGSTAGRPDSVVDVTHHVRVPFSTQYRASYGFLVDNTGTSDGAPSAANGVLTYNDFLFGACLQYAAGVSQTGCTTGARNLVNAAVLTNVDATGDQVSDGTGFGMYINAEPFIFLTSALPSSTVWTLRTYMGEVKKTGSTYSFAPWPSNAAVPGLTVAVVIGQATTYPDTVGDLSNVHTVPDPYYVTNQLEITASTKVLRFVNLPDRAIIRIYSVSGILVNILTHNDPAGGGEEAWNLRNRNNQFVASGVYFYHVETPDGRTKIGRFTVVNYAQ